MNVQFYYGTKAAYDALATKDASSLYFLTDVLQLKRGTEDYSKDLAFVDALPETGALQGRIYFRSSDATLWSYNGTKFVQLTREVISAIPDTIADTDFTMPSTKAVADYVAAKIAAVETKINGGVVSDIAWDETKGAIQKTINAVTTDVQLTGMLHEPTWNATARKLTIPVWGKDAFEIDFGKDNFVTSGAYNAETKEIELTLVSGDVVKVPAASLVDIYTGVATSSVDLKVNEKNEISASVKVSAKANNILVLEEDGLYVGLPDAYTKAETDAAIKVVADDLATHKADAVSHITADERTTWNAKINETQMNEAIEAAKTAVTEAAATDATTKANKALADAKAYTDEKDTAMGGRVDAVEATLTWKQIA